MSMTHNRTRLLKLYAVLTILLLLAACAVFVASADGQSMDRTAPTATQPPPDLLLYLQQGQRVDILGDCDSFVTTLQRGHDTLIVECVMDGD